MFTKQTKAAPTAEAGPPRKVSVASFVAEGVTLRGDLATAGDLHLDGRVEGDVAAGHLTIGETGAVTGSVRADCVEIRGRVVGTVLARQVRLWATARIDGDISHAELAIEAGAHFEGRSVALPPDTAEEPRALSVVAAE